MPAPSAAQVAQVAAVRRFNRFYTARADLLHEGHLDSAFSLAEVRILFELAHREGTTAAALCRDLRLDAGYVSRMLRGFQHRAFVDRARSATDGRATLLSLTARGRAAFGPLERAAGARVRAMLAPLDPDTRDRVVAAMSSLGAALGADWPSTTDAAGERATKTPARVLLHRPRPGELGWVVQRHGALYASEYGYDQRFEGLVAQVVGEFVGRFDPKWDRCWIAEQDGRPVGSVFVVRLRTRIARLRLLLVDPSARGGGIGARLVRACTTFARSRGYRAIELWTQRELVAARTLYQREGYRLLSQRRHAMFGRPAVAETWRLEISTR